MLEYVSYSPYLIHFFYTYIHYINTTHIIYILSHLIHYTHALYYEPMQAR